MTDSKLPFFAQTALLDRYIKTEDLSAIPQVVEVIVKAIRENSELRRYFFRNAPHPAWASVLWDYDMLKKAPMPEKDEDSSWLPWWEAQEYLISVAEQAPQIVIRHINSIEGHIRYKARAIQAARFIPIEYIESVLRPIIKWLSDWQTGQAVAEDAYDLMLALAEKKHPASLVIFRSLSTPFPSTKVQKIRGSIFGAEAVSMLQDSRWSRRQENTLKLLHEVDIQQVASILEDQLRLSLRIETESKQNQEFEFKFSSWWRPAIEDTNQDNHNHFKDVLLEGLRDTLEVLAGRDKAATEHILGLYAGEKHEILRRLRLHVLNSFPSEFREEVAAELTKEANYNDIGVHHEFFMLLKNGFLHLRRKEKEEVIRLILKGPNKKELEWMHEDENESSITQHADYVKGYIRRWMRDRLWMIREHLEDEGLELLNDINAEFEEPKHPEFTHWSTGAFFVADVGPLPPKQLATMSSIELLAYLKHWQPPPNQFGPRVVSYRGMGESLANIILANPERYQADFVNIGLLRPEYAYAFFRLAENDNDNKNDFKYVMDAKLWSLFLDLCEQLLEDENLRKDMSRTSEITWRDTRHRMVNLIEKGLKRDQNKADGAIPQVLLTRVQDVLIVLINDPDPDLKGDRPDEGWVGYGDPVSVAINHVRPDALRILIEYAFYIAEQKQERGSYQGTEGPGPNRLSEAIETILTEKLNRSEDPSWAVHSVYGRSLLQLYWLNLKWVEKHINDIFPEEDTEDSSWYYAAAWDSYVIFNNPYYKDLFELLRPKYSRAIENHSKGLVTRTHLQPGESLARHILGEYLYADYDIRTSIGQESLTAKFFQRTPPSTRGSAIWLLWKSCKEQPELLEKYWPRARDLWHWRVEMASSDNNSTDYDEEMSWFPHLLEVVPQSETIISLWPILEGSLPYLSRTRNYGMTWELFENFLSREVERDTLRTIKLYRLMHEYAKRPTWFRQQKGRIILQTGLKDQSSKETTLSLIDLIAQMGDPQYNDLYDKYTE